MMAPAVCNWIQHDLAIMPTCAILLIMNMGSVLNVGFDKIYLMQNSAEYAGHRGHRDSPARSVLTASIRI